MDLNHLKLGLQNYYIHMYKLVNNVAKFDLYQ